MNIIFVITFVIIIICTLPALYFLYKLITSKNNIVANTDIGQIRFLKEMEVLEKRYGDSNTK